MHFPLVGCAGARPVPRGEGGGSGTGPTRQCFPAATLVNAHGDLTDAVFHHRVGRHHKLDVGTIGWLRIKPRDVAEVSRRQFVLAGECDNNVRVADIDAEPGTRDVEVLRANQWLAAIERPTPEVDLKALQVALKVAHSPAGSDGERAGRVKVDQPVL